MKYEIEGKEYTIKKLTWSDIEEFGDYLKEQKLKMIARLDGVIEEGSEIKDSDLNAILRPLALSQDPVIPADVIKGLESHIRSIQNKRNIIVNILSEPISINEVMSNIDTLKGRKFIIWLAIRNNGIKLEDMDNIINFDNSADLTNLIEIVGIGKRSDSKKAEAETDNTSP